MKKLLFAALTFCLSGSCLAQGLFSNAATYDRVLVPIATADIPGGYGSLWHSQVLVHNSDSVPRDVQADEYCAVPEGCPTVRSSGETGELRFSAEPADNPGLIVFVENPSDLVTFESRVQDLSRQAQTWGTEIPVVREDRFVTRPIDLVNVPSDGRFRLTLRIYDIDGRTDGAVRVSVFELPGKGAPVGSVDLPLSPPGGFHPRYKPAYAQYSNILGLFPPGFNPGAAFGVRIAPSTPGLRMWAFISVTNNETQHVTLITPQ